MTKKIPISQDKFALVDDEWYEYLSQWKWSDSLGYASRNEGKQINKQWVHSRGFKMHRVIMGATDGQVVDHINGDILDNRVANLRLCTIAENIRHRVKLNVNNTSGYRGVRFAKHARLWEARITLNRKGIHLGYFRSAEDAVRAYDEATHKYFGEFASPNFK